MIILSGENYGLVEHLRPLLVGQQNNTIIAVDGTQRNILIPVSANAKRRQQFSEIGFFSISGMWALPSASDDWQPSIVRLWNGRVFMNILVAGFRRETNTFAPTMATYDSSVRGVGTLRCRTPSGIQRQS